MVGFSMRDVAFGGFADVHAHPRALAVWTPFAFVMSAGVQVASLGVVAPRLDPWSLTQDPAQAMAVLQKMLPPELAIAAVFLVVTAIVQAAMIRLVLRPAEARFGYVRLGADELRQLALAIMGVAVVTAVYFAAFTALTLVFGVLGGAAGAPLGLVIGLDLAATACVVVLVCVRLSLAPALTFDRRHVDLFGSWALTRGRFWPLLGTYSLVLGLSAVIYAVAAVLIFGLGGLVMGPDIVALDREPATLSGLLSPTHLILAVFRSFLVALVWPVLFTPSARLYATLAPRPKVATGLWA